jgi:hypothetical protein
MTKGKMHSDLSESRRKPTNLWMESYTYGVSCICSIYLFLPRVVILPSYNSLDSIETMYREGDWERTSMQRKTPNPRKNPVY